MHFLESRIRQYELARFTTDDNRRVFPFHWGLEYIGGPAVDSPEPEDAAVAQSREVLDPRAYLTKWVPETIAHSDAWFATTPASDYRLEPITQNGSRASAILSFTSAIESPWPTNNHVVAQFFPARPSGPAVVLLPNWNAKWHGQQSLCLWLTKLGISVLRMSMPYHDSRRAAGHERADQLVGANIGLTLQANRQAVLDTRRCLAWLHARGHERLGIVGTSIGSSIGCITLAHEPLARVGAFLHVSTYFGDVVRAGMTTGHVWESLRAHVSPDELRDFWSPISPVPYLAKLAAAHKSFFAVSGKYDPTFLPEFTQEMYAALRRHKVQHEKIDLHCGHYSLELPPFSYIAGFRLGMFLRDHLT